MEAAGIAVAVAGLGPPIAELIAGLRDFYARVRRFEKDSQDSSLKFQALTRRYESLQNVLFTKKFSFVKSTIFDELDLEDKKIVFTVWKGLPRLLYKYYTLERGYQIQLQLEEVKSSSGGTTDIPPAVLLTPEQRKLLFDDNAPPRTKHSSVLSYSGLSWAVRGQKRAERLNIEFEEWLNLIRNTLEDVWYPLSFFDKFVNLKAVENDPDAQQAGLAQPASLRKLIVSDAKLSSSLNLGRLQFKIAPLDSPRRGTTSIDGQAYLVEILNYDLDQDGFLSQLLEKRFSTIANLLHQQNDPVLRVLSCKGYVNTTYPRRQFQLLFPFPGKESCEPVSLLHYLTSPRRASLGDRMRLGYELAQTLALMHSVGWIHKAIRSENVLFFNVEQANATPSFLNGARLCGFEASRLESDFSTAAFDNDIQLNIYRHPQRWGIPQKVFSKHHDI
jgi:serine/threonine protein kinase